MNLENFFSLLWASPDLRGGNYTVWTFLALIVASITFGLLISHLYKRYFDSNSTGSSIHRSFPLLAPSVTTIFLTVQFSLPLSLGLLGALSIVRFRTPIKEPEEIGFIMVVIACSLSIATFNLLFALVLYLAIFIVLELRTRFGVGSAGADAMHTVLSLSVTQHGASQSETDSGIDLISQLQTHFSNASIKTKILSSQQSAQNEHLTLLLRCDLTDARSLFQSFDGQDRIEVADFYQK